MAESTGITPADPVTSSETSHTMPADPDPPVIEVPPVKLSKHGRRLGRRPRNYVAANLQESVMVLQQLVQSETENSSRIRGAVALLQHFQNERQREDVRKADKNTTDELATLRREVEQMRLQAVLDKGMIDIYKQRLQKLGGKIDI